MKMNTSITSLDLLAETVELECKLAAGKSGRGELPKDFWPTYSAFANAHGGVVLLGIKEKPRGTFSAVGIKDSDKVITDLFNQLNNPAKVNTNLLSDDDVEKLSIDGKTVIKITVPQANRNQKPVFINDNLFSGCYKRLHEGDRLCSNEEVRRMLAEQSNEPRDQQILIGFGWEDIDQQTFSIYRQKLRDTKPNHPFLEHDDFGLLKKIKGWRRDRQSGEEGLTLAGLLMFGKWEAIQEAAPNYFVDYQERPLASNETRWLDRLVPDGTWSGNLFDFYRTVDRKLTSAGNLKIPFRLESGQRQDETPVHEALREALVNTIVHADYSERISLLVVKKPDMFRFRNPGDMRIPLQRALSGGDSDCRNRIMHQMFLMIGVGERAGSGVPKIYSGWEWGRWRKPALYEIDEPSQTVLELRMLSLMPEEVQESLQRIFGIEYNELSQLEHMILCTAYIEEVVSHGRIAEIATDHPHDISLAFQSLVKRKMLAMQGYGRGAVYHLHGTSLPTPDQVFGEAPSYHDGTLTYSGGSATYSGGSATYSGGSATYSGGNETYSGGSGGEGSVDAASQSLDEKNRLISPELDAPAIHDLAALEPNFLAGLKEQAYLAREKRRLNATTMQRLILQLCTEQFITRACLAELLKRNADTLRKEYLNPLVEDKLIALAFPQTPNDKRQAYITSEKGYNWLNEHKNE